MNNKRKVFEGIEVINPVLVIKIGFVYDSYKHDRLDELWESGEIEAIKQMPTLKPNELFFQEEMKSDDQNRWYSFRFYTPKSNIKEGK